MSSLKSDKTLDGFTLVYIDDLSARNYKENIPTFRENLNKVMRLGNLGILKLSLATGVHRLTLRNFLVENNDNIAFSTACKFNYFVLKLYRESTQDPADPAVDLLKMVNRFSY